MKLPYRGWIDQRCVALIAVLVTMSVASTHACNVPVFRYALERWQPDPFQVTVFHRGPLTDEQQKLVDRIDGASHAAKPANVRVAALDLDKLGELSEETQEWVKAQEIPDTLPHMLVEFPYHVRTDQAAWRGPLSGDAVTNMLDSPLRQDIIKKLVSGHSAVWVCIESGNKEADDKAFKLLSETVETLEKELRLPDQEVLESDEFFKADTAVELRLDFTTVRVSREDAEEHFFIQMLLNSEPDLNTFKEPIAIPVFGRGRSYFALVGKGIKEEILAEDCAFIVGPCSCQVKAENPGADLLFSADWDSLVTKTAFKDEELPELTGIGAFEKAKEQAESIAKAEDSTVPLADTDTVEPDHAIETQATESSSTFIVLPVLGVLGVLVLLAGVGTVVLGGNNRR